MNKRVAKRGVVLLLALMLSIAFSFSACAQEAYTGIGQGHAGEIKVNVEVEDGVIKSVEVVSHSDTPGISDKAIEQMPVAIVAANSVEIDVVAGATNTSKGILEAVKGALVQAGVLEEKAKNIPALEPAEMNNQINLDAWNQAWIDKMANSSIEYAPVVKTLENGVKIQKVPSDPIFWNTGVLDAENRGCSACHDLEAVMENLPYKHYTLKAVGTMELNISTCQGCHRGYFEMWEDYITLDDAMHALHYNNPNFTGNCLSCHQIDAEGNYVMWDYEKYKRLRGTTMVSDVQGTFRYDQDKTVEIDDRFVMFASGSPAHGVPPYSPDNQEVFENWEIRISGDVENPYTLKLTDILEEELVTYNLSHRCVIENSGLISNLPFTGIRLADVIAKAVPKAGANQISVIAPSYPSVGDCTYLLDKVMNSEKSMLAIRLGDDPLPADIGYPVICMMEGMPASHNQRQVTEIVVQTMEEPYGSYDYLDYGLEGDDIFNGPSCGIVNVYDGQIFEYGEPIVFEGYADAFADTITCVKFSMDNGATWTKYDIPDADNDRWVYFWYEPKDLPMGSYVLTVSAETVGGRVNDHEFKMLFHVQ